MKNWLSNLGDEIRAAITAWWLIGRLPIWAEETRKAITSIIGCELKALIATIVRWSKHDFSRRPLHHRTSEAWDSKLTSMPVTALLLTPIYGILAIAIIHYTWGSWWILGTGPLALFALVLAAKCFCLGFSILVAKLRKHIPEPREVTANWVMVRLYMGNAVAIVLMAIYGSQGWQDPAPKTLIYLGVGLLIYLLYNINLYRKLTFR